MVTLLIKAVKCAEKSPKFKTTVIYFNDFFALIMLLLPTSFVSDFQLQKEGKRMKFVMKNAV